MENMRIEYRLAKFKPDSCLLDYYRVGTLEELSKIMCGKIHKTRKAILKELNEGHDPEKEGYFYFF